jgi:hypothetical protein
VTEPSEAVAFNLTIDKKSGISTGMDPGLDNAIKNSMTMDLLLSDDPKKFDIFYEPNISKPIRSHRDVSVVLNKKGKLEGMPTVWREALKMDPQEKEVEELNYGMEINQKKL